MTVTQRNVSSTSAVAEKSSKTSSVEGEIDLNDKSLYFNNVPSLAELKNALPADCFQAELATSFYYVVRNIAHVVLLFLAMYWARQQSWYQGSFFVQSALILAYWILQGTLFWGFFVLGHDCGHQSFSSSTELNWIVGNFLHTFILTPYEPWKLSHNHHHKNTGNIDTDEIFFPLREDGYIPRVKVAPAFLGLTWWVYLVVGHGPRNVYHLNVWEPLFASRKARVAMSLGSLVLALFVMMKVVAVYGLWSLVLYHTMPVIVFGSWLVMVTFLHHHDEKMPWYAGKEWDYVRGNLSSIDRSYFPFDNLSHHIGTHQIHHLFPVIPHYKLEKATAVFRQKYPQFVRKSNEHFLVAFVKCMRTYIKQKPLPLGLQKWVFH